MTNSPESPQWDSGEAFLRLESAVGFADGGGDGRPSEIKFPNDCQLCAWRLNEDGNREIAISISKNERPCLSFVIRENGIKSLCIFCEFNLLVGEKLILVEDDMLHLDAGGNEIPPDWEILVMWVEKSVKKGELEPPEPELKRFIFALMVKDRVGKISQSLP